MNKKFCDYKSLANSQVLNSARVCWEEFKLLQLVNCELSPMTAILVVSHRVGNFRSTLGCSCLALVLKRSMLTLLQLFSRYFAARCCEVRSEIGY